jgi:hypothetical protein
MVSTTTTVISCRRPKNGPSFRDFDVYRFVKIERHSTREAAEAFGISQTRVRQILDAIVEYLMECVPFNEEGERIDRLQVAEQLAREQLEYLYGQAMEWWRRSVSEHRSGTGMPKASYLALAARITMCMARVPVHEPPGWARESGIADREGEVPAEPTSGRAGRVQGSGFKVQEERRAGEMPAPQIENPPVEDCSLGDVSRGSGKRSESREIDATDSLPSPYELVQQLKARAKRDFLRPAQATLAARVDSPESMGGEPSIGAARPLNRKERRARQRQLARILKKR